MDKKYKLTEESINFFDKKLYRIEALKDFSEIKKGDKGGYVENENNLSHTGNCWIYNNARVLGKAKVFNDAKVFDNVKIFNEAQVYGNALVGGNALICGNALVYGEAQVYGRGLVGGNAWVDGNARVFGSAQVCDNAWVCGNARVFGSARVCDNAAVFDNAQVFGDAYVCGNAQVCGTAEIKNNSDYIIFKNWWSSGRHFTWTRSNNMWKVGCFYGTGKELIAKAYKDSELSGREYERVVNYVETILQDSKGIGD